MNSNSSHKHLHLRERVGCIRSLKRKQRKQEHKEFNNLMASNTAVKELLMFAKNRLIQVLQPQTLRTLSWTPHCYWTDWYWTSNWGSWMRTSDSKTLTEKESTKANLVRDLDLGATLEYIISSRGVWLAHNILWLWRIMKQRALRTVADCCGLLWTVVDCCGLLWTVIEASTHQARWRCGPDGQLGYVYIYIDILVLMQI